MKFNKQKIFEVILTALMSALIAFMQSVIAQHVGVNTDQGVPVVAGVIGAVARSCRA